jgi:DNA-binding CsgD family transcriptional regulator
MTLATATEFAVMLTAADLQEPLAAPGAGQLSRRERELVTLVAQGRTDAQIAGLLFISIRTVRSTWTGSATRPAAAAAPT